MTERDLVGYGGLVNTYKGLKQTPARAARGKGGRLVNTYKGLKLKRNGWDDVDLIEFGEYL